MNPSRSELSRRDLLQFGGLGMLGITLPQLCRLRRSPSLVRDPAFSSSNTVEPAISTVWI